MLIVRNLTRVFKTAKKVKVTALKNVNLSFPEQGLVMILGASGSGKTTLLNLLGTLDKPTEGEICLVSGGREIRISELSEQELDIFRNRVLGFIFQDYSLIEHWSVEENIRIALEQQNWPQKTAEDEEKRIREVLEFVGLSEMQWRRIQELSGGEQQRVAIARALVKRPAVILADEPTGNLDYENSCAVLKLLKDCSRQCLVIMVTHDAELAENYADRIIKIRYGEIQEDRIIKSNQTESAEETAPGKNENPKNLENISLESPAESETTACAPVLNGEKTEPARLRSRTVLQLAVSSIRVRKFKLVFMLLAMLIVLGVIKLVTAFSTIDIGKTMAHYMTANEVEYFEGHEDISCFIEELTYEFTIGNRSAYYELLKECFGEDYMYPVIGGATATAYTGALEEFCSLVVGGEVLQKDSLTGRLPEAENEIVITDYAAKQLELGENCIGAEIEINHIPMVVSGIIVLAQKAYVSGYFEEGCRFLVSERFYDYQAKQECIALPFAMLNRDLVMTDITDSRTVLYSPEALENAEYVYGHAPASAGEIAISRSYAESQMLIDDNCEPVDSGSRGRKIGFLNLQLEAQPGDPALSLNPVALDGYLNLGELLPEVKIVGIYEDEEESVILDKSDFELVRESYCDAHIADSYETKTTSATRKNKSIYRKLYNAGITFDMDLIDTYIEGYESCRGYHWVFQIVLLIMTPLLALLMIIFFAFNVKDNYHRIGILRALGVRHREIARMYLYEAGIVAIVLELLSVIINAIIVLKINLKFRSRLQLVSNLVYHNAWTEFAVALGILLITVLTVLIPLWLAEDKKPIDLMKTVK